MKNQIRTRKILIANTLIILLFLGAMVAINLTLLHQGNDTLRELDEHHNRKLLHIFKLEEIARERSLAMLTMYMSTDPWVQDEQFELFHHLAGGFIYHRQQLQGFSLLASEQALLTQALAIIRQTEPMQADIVERLQAGQITGVRRDIAELDLPKETELHAIFEDLIQLVQEHARLASEQAREEYRNNLDTGIVASALILLALFLIMRRSLASIGNIEVELLQQTHELSWEASHDPLTKLLNRRGLSHHLQRLDELSQTGEQHTLLYLDLDDFKPVNDQFGHEFGDRMLIELSAEFHGCIRRHDAIARIGGDEFAVVLEDCDEATALRIAQCMIDKARNHVLQNDKLAIKISGCSIGLLGFTAGEYDVETLLKQADIACYESKRLGKNRVNRYVS